VAVCGGKSTWWVNREPGLAFGVDASEIWRQWWVLVSITADGDAAKIPALIKRAYKIISSWNVTGLESDGKA